MKNCYEKKLRGAVANSNLDYYNALKFVKTNFSASGVVAELKFGVYSGKTIKLAIPKGVSFQRNVEPISTSSNSTHNIYVFPSVSLTFTVDSNIYNLYVIEGIEDITSISGGGGSQIRLVNPILLSDCKRLTTLNISNFLNSAETGTAKIDLVGDLTDLAYSVNLTGAQLANAKVEGRLECFAEIGWAAGRRSGSIVVRYISKVQTFNGVAPSSYTDYTFTFSANNVVVTVGGNTVGTYNGSAWTYS